MNVKRFLIAIFVLIMSMQVHSTIRFHVTFHSNMVLQRNAPIKFWGTKDIGETVEIELNGISAAYTAGTTTWELELAPMGAGGPYELYLNSQLKYDNVMIGDVWLCGGQSNMQTKIKDYWYKDYVDNVDYPNIRYLNSAEYTGWTDLSHPATPTPSPVPEVMEHPVQDLSATAFFFAKELHESQLYSSNENVPIGLIVTAVGGTVVETYLSPSKAYELGLITEEEYLSKTYTSQYMGQTVCGFYYIIDRVAGYGIKGAIWYQGESNAYESSEYENLDRTKDYQKHFTGLITSWREAWGQGDFPFLYVQLPEFTADLHNKPLQYNTWSNVREAQRLTLDSVPDTYMAVTLGSTSGATKGHIHPANKHIVGKRLALIARKNVYGELTLPADSPKLENIAVNGNNQVELTYSNTGAGLAFDLSLTKNGFAIAEKDGGYYWAQASISTDGTKVILENTQLPVSDPVSIAYAWALNPYGGLYSTSTSGELFMPASPFKEVINQTPVPVNLAAGKYVDVSSVYSPDYGAEKIVNGDVITGNPNHNMWLSSGTDLTSDVDVIYIDLKDVLSHEQTYAIDKIHIDWGEYVGSTATYPCRPKKFSLWISDDLVNTRRIAYIEDNNENTYTVDTKINSRYIGIRLYEKHEQTKFDNKYYYGIKEIMLIQHQ